MHWKSINRKLCIFMHFPLCFLHFRSFYNAFMRFCLNSMDEYCQIIDNLGETEVARDVYRYHKKNLQVLASNYGNAYLCS